MFIGHFAVGFAAKAAAPRTSLGALIAAACGADLLWPILLLAGIEKVRIDPGNTAFTPLDFVSYPISHSLLTDCLWGVLLGIGYRVATGYARGGLMMGLAFVSHWFLDFATHRPDMPLLPWGGAKWGLGLWNSIPGTLAVESAMFLASLLLYTRVTAPRDGIGRWGYVSFVAVLLGMYAADALGTPPPDVRSLALVSLGLFLFLLWPAWFDLHRKPTRAVEAGNL
jgi:hypothetical protein